MALSDSVNRLVRGALGQGGNAAPTSQAATGSAEPALQRLQIALDILPWGIMTAELSDRPRLVYCNRRAADLLQIPAENLLGAKADDLIRVIGLDAGEGSLFERASRIEHEVERSPGVSCWLCFHFIPAPQDKYCFIVIDDITDSKLMESQYFQGQRLEALGQLAGGVAHDFNNILSIIDGYARMARKSLDPDSEAAAFMEHIGKAVQRGSALTGQLLTFGRHKISKERVVDLGQLVEDQAPLLRPLMDATITLSLDSDPDVFVKVPPDYISQILMNLCVNARDAMPDGGQLIIEVRNRPPGHALLQVIDTGCGIPADIKAKIFDPFFTTKENGKGTGLGLSMVYGLVRDMHGTISVSSKPGSGTSFVIMLPLSASSAISPEQTTAAGGTPTLEGLTALVAEDEPDLLNLVSTMMEDMGATVLRAANGQEALAIQERYPGEIDLLLTDVVMPELNGVKLAELFEAQRPSSKIMFMSGYPATGQMARVPLPEGATLMPKPVDFPTLCRVIHSMMSGDNDNLQGHWDLTGRWRSA